MKKMICILLLTVLFCSCLPAAAPAEEELTEVLSNEWHFSVRIPDGLYAYPASFEDWYFDTPIAGGLVLLEGAGDELPQIRIMRRGRIYDPGLYLNGYFCEYLDGLGENEADNFRVYRFGDRALYGNMGIVYGEEGEEQFREIRLIPVSGDHGTEFIARYTAETEERVFAMLDTVVRYYREDEEPEKEKAAFLPEGHEDGADLQNGRYLLRVKDADRIESDGYFTAILYRPDYYSADAVHAMKPGDTILIMDRVLRITGIDPREDDDGSWYEAELFAEDAALEKLHYSFTLTLKEDGTAYWPYFGEDNHSASRVDEVRIRVPQPGPVEYCADSEEGTELFTDDLLGSIEGDPALFGLGWNEYTHRCTFADGNLIWVGTWYYPVNPEDVFVEWQ